MKLFSANLDDLRSLYIDHLQTALDMEQKVVKALPTMAEKSTDPKLATAFSNHLEQSEGHVDKIETILRRITGEASTTNCKIVAGLISEAEDNIKGIKDTSLRDISLIDSGQQVEHHEMAVYGTLRNWAGMLGQSSDVTVFESILREEEAASELLTQISGGASLRAAA